MNDEQFRLIVIDLLKGINSNLTNIGCGLTTIILLLGIIVGLLWT